MPPCLKAAQVTFALEHKTGFFQLKHDWQRISHRSDTYFITTFLRATAYLSSGANTAQTLVFMGIKVHFSHRNIKSHES